jgi:ribosome biogenesis protein Nip4
MYQHVLKKLLFYVQMDHAFLKELTVKDLKNVMQINQLDVQICNVTKQLKNVNQLMVAL